MNFFKHQDICGRSRIFNVLPSRRLPKLIGLDHPMLKGLLDNVEIPDVVNVERITELPYDQSGGSCVGNALSKTIAIARDLKLPDAPARNMIWLLSKETDPFGVRESSAAFDEDGTTLESALKIVTEMGYCSESAWPHVNQDGRVETYAGDKSVLMALADKNRIAGFVNLGVNVDTWAKFMKKFKRPVYCAASIDENFCNVDLTGQIDRYDRSRIVGGHAGCLTGVKRTSVNRRVTWLNSWGPDWGDLGHVHIIDKVAVKEITEAWGVLLPTDELPKKFKPGVFQRLLASVWGKKKSGGRK